MKFQRYDIQLVHKPGKEMYVADTLSRAYLKHSDDNWFTEDFYVNTLSSHLPVSDEKLAEFRSATANDSTLQTLKSVVLNGWSTEKSRSRSIYHAYWAFRDEISYIDQLLFKGPRLIIPATLRQDMLRRIHESHLGIVKCKQRARYVLYWPGMSGQIEDVISSCHVCATNQRDNSKEPLISHDILNRPWAKVGTDLFHYNGSEYVLCVDYFSKFIEIAKLLSCTSSETITMLKSMFARHGIPDEVVSDNGLQYSSLEFKAFALSWEFTHITTGPGFAQSNGQAERTVQTVKNILKKAAKDKTDPYLALLAYRNSPLDGVGLSPSQLMMSRRTKSKLPTSASLLKPSVRDGNDIHDKLRQRQDEQKRHHDVGAYELPPLRPGDTVRIRQSAFLGGNWDKAAVVSTNHNAPRSYIVTTPDGRKYRRNR